MKAVEALLESLTHDAMESGTLAALRGLVLELAVRGSLIKQIQGDETAAELLERIAVPDVRRSRVSVDVTKGPDEAPFPVPESWTWICWAV